eukprot:5484751-Alexandrium_andersonii.AAC.1
MERLGPAALNALAVMEDSVHWGDILTEQDLGDLTGRQWQICLGAVYPENFVSESASSHSRTDGSSLA